MYTQYYGTINMQILYTRYRSIIVDGQVFFESLHMQNYRGS